MSLLRPSSSTPIGDMIRDSTGSVEDQERSALDELFDRIGDFGSSLIYGGSGGVSNNFPGTPYISPGDDDPIYYPSNTTPEQALEQWFENNQDASAQEIFNVMQANNVSPEYVIGQWGLDPASAMATYNTFLNPTPSAPPVTPPVTPPATGGQDIVDVIKGIPGEVVGAVKSTADTLLNQIKEFLPFYDQAQVVLNPTTGQATIVFGTPPAGQPVVQVGNLPKSNTNVGVTTGIPILDQAINSVLNRPGGLDSGSIRDAVIDIIAKQVGLDPAQTAAIMGEDLETILATANTVLAQSATQLGVGLTGPKEEDDVVDDLIRNSEGSNVIRDVDDLVTGGPQNQPALTPADLGEGDPLKGLVGGSEVEGLTRAPTLTPADLGEGATTPPRASTPPRSVGGSGMGTPQYGQGIRGVKTEQAGVADINNTFDLQSSLLDNIIRTLSREGDNRTSGSYYRGGEVSSSAELSELLRILRG